MNLSQRIVLVLAFLVILVMALFPPWVYVSDSPQLLRRAERPAGYHLIFGQHAPEDIGQLATLFSLEPNQDGTSLRYFSIRLDGTLLLVQITATMLLTSILYLALRRR